MLRRGTVLVTGGAGFIGSHACKALARAGYVPVAYDNLSNGHRDAVRWGPFVDGDVADSTLLSTTMRHFSVSAVMHFAAYAYVGESIVRPRDYMVNNVCGSLKLLDSMLACNVRHMVFSSTCATYGVPASIPIKETTPQDPVNPYGESKRTVERILRWYSEAYSLKSVALRYFNAAGADLDGEIGEDHKPETHLIPLALEVASRRRSHLEIYGSDYGTRDGTALRDYIHVTDLAEAHVLALAYLERGGATTAFNLGTGRAWSVVEVIETAQIVTGRKIPVHLGLRRHGDPDALVADATRAREVLGWTPKTPELADMIRTAWVWHKHRFGAIAAASGA